MTTYPKNITSYDVLKFMAIILMIVDHLGYYVFDNESWMRVFGRLCVPIWFFLIGYSISRTVPLKIVLGAFLVIGANLVAGEHFFPLCILITLMLTRLCMDGFMRAVLRGGEALAGLFSLLIILSLPSFVFFEYGTIGALFAVIGGFCRYRQTIPEISENVIIRRQMFLFSAASFVFYLVFQGLSLEELNVAQFLVFVLGLIFVWVWLASFKSEEFLKLSDGLPNLFVRAIQFTGRRTLEIYVLHLIALKLWAMVMLPDQYQLLSWQWMHPHILGIFQFIFGV